MTRSKRSLAATLVTVLAFAAGATREVLATCGPFTDVPDGYIFCNSILQIYYLGITLGTSPTTYDPTGNVTRGQMAAFLARTYDRAAARTSRRAALNQWWTGAPYPDGTLGLTTVGAAPRLLQSDGADVWVPNVNSGTVSRVRASDGKVLETWTGATSAFAVLVAMGRVFVTGATSPAGTLYMIDPTQAAGPVTPVATNLGEFSRGIAFDGTQIWTVSQGGGSVSIVTPGAWSVMTVSGFGSLRGALYDGSNIWVTDSGDNTIKKLDGAGGVLQSVAVGTTPNFPVFDGRNIWVPNAASNSVTVVRPSDGTVLQTLAGNGLNVPVAAAFDGQRILVANYTGNSVSLFKAADLSPLGSLAMPSANPAGACSDGISFWISLDTAGKVARF